MKNTSGIHIKDMQAEARSLVRRGYGSKEIHEELKNRTPLFFPKVPNELDLYTTEQLFILEGEAIKFERALASGLEPMDMNDIELGQDVIREDFLNVLEGCKTFEELAQAYKDLLDEYCESNASARKFEKRMIETFGEEKVNIASLGSRQAYERYKAYTASLQAQLQAFTKNMADNEVADEERE